MTIKISCVSAINLTWKKKIANWICRSHAFFLSSAFVMTLLGISMLLIVYGNYYREYKILLLNFYVENMISKQQNNVFLEQNKTLYSSFNCSTIWFSFVNRYFSSFWCEKMALTRFDLWLQIHPLLARIIIIIFYFSLNLIKFNDKINTFFVN